jgi:hypothetical protein
MKPALILNALRLVCSVPTGRGLLREADPGLRSPAATLPWAIFGCPYGAIQRAGHPRWHKFERLRS